MKNAIKTLLDAVVYDNADYIKENGGNAAYYILEISEAEDQGWLFFLSDNEIDEFESDKNIRTKYIQEIRDYVNENYN